MSSLVGRTWRSTFAGTGTIAALAAFSGCVDATNPGTLRDSASPAVVGTAAVRAAPDVFDDAINRLLPRFSDRARADVLNARLAEFSAAYQVGADASARTALERARRLVEMGGAHAADLSALELAVGRAEALMDSTTALGNTP
jgi:hypothetical protein